MTASRSRPTSRHAKQGGGRKLRGKQRRWRRTPQDQVARILPEVITAMTKLLERRSVAIHADTAEGAWGGGAGTLVQLGGHVLVATAAHVIEGMQPSDTVLLHASARRPFKGLVQAMWAHSEDSDDPIDVGIIELDSMAVERAGWECICLDDIECAGSSIRDELFSLYGYPSGLRRANPRSRQVGVAPAMYASACRPPSKWPRGRLRPPANRRIDVMIDYIKGRSIPRDRFGRASPHPAGFSGGGIWATHIAEKRLWSPSHARLVGLIRGWLEESQLIRGVQVRHWLELVAATYADLAPAIRRKLRYEQDRRRR